MPKKIVMIGFCILFEFSDIDLLELRLPKYLYSPFLEKFFEENVHFKVEMHNA